MTAASATVVRYEPRGAARDLFSARDDEVLLVGAAGTGKSLACLYRLHFAALKHPGMRALIVRKTATSLGATTLVTFEKKVAKAAIKGGVVRWFGGSTREAACYRYPDDAVIVVGGMDKPEKIMSSEYDLVFADEATELTEADWDAIKSRLRNGVLPWQQQIAACNPDRPTHWLKQRANTGQLRMLESRHRDNPAYVNTDGTYTPAGADYMKKLDGLTGVRRLRLRDSKWAAAEGLVYDQFDDTVHLVDKLPAGSEAWTRWWTVDFGFSNPFVCQFWAEDPDGRLYRYREIYRTKTLVEDHAKHILSIVAPRGAWIEPQPTAIICDHDAEDRATLERHLGMGTSAAHKTIKDGVQAVQSRLKAQADGKPRLFLVRDALVAPDPELAAAKKPTCTEEEITGYVWPDGDKNPDKREVPVKVDDHGMDAMRYMVAQADLGARPNFRWL